jgi:hypothetical protein
VEPAQSRLLRLEIHSSTRQGAGGCDQITWTKCQALLELRERTGRHGPCVSHHKEAFASLGKAPAVSHLHGEGRVENLVGQWRDGKDKVGRLWGRRQM